MRKYLMENSLVSFLLIVEGFLIEVKRGAIGMQERGWRSHALNKYISCFYFENLKYYRERVYVELREGLVVAPSFFIINTTCKCIKF